MSDTLYPTKKINFDTILFSIYLNLVLLRYLWPANSLLTSIVVLIGLASLFLFSRKIPLKNLVFYQLMISLVIAFLLSSLFVAREDRIIHVLLFILINFGIALLLVRGNILGLGAYLTFYPMALYMASMILRGVDPNVALEVVSRNGISELMIICCVCFYIVASKNHTPIDIKPAFFTLLISIWGIGRSGIVASLFIFVGLCFLKFKLKKWHFFVILLILAWLFNFFLDEVLLILTNFNLFGNAIDFLISRNNSGPDSRFDIWANYFNNLNVFRFFLGANVLTDPWPEGQRLAYNYHNMFIQLHFQTGLVAIVIYMLMFLALLKFWKMNRMYFILFFAICLRGMTDTFMFFESWDFVFYFFIFYYLSESNIRAPVMRTSSNKKCHF